jgi:hypothetical protein
VVAERRKSGRETAGVSAACRVRGIAYRARLSDVSHFGCCAEMTGAVAQPGDRVVLQLGRLLVLPALIRWVAEDRAGLEFANPLHGAMLSQFVSRQRDSAVGLNQRK